MAEDASNPESEEDLLTRASRQPVTGKVCFFLCLFVGRCFAALFLDLSYLSLLTFHITTPRL
jgi:hypothetical protein